MATCWGSGRKKRSYPRAVIGSRGDAEEAETRRAARRLVSSPYTPAFVFNIFKPEVGRAGILPRPNEPDSLRTSASPREKKRPSDGSRRALVSSHTLKPSRIMLSVPPFQYKLMPPGTDHRGTARGQ